jgi:hypothetical protein
MLSRLSIGFIIKTADFDHWASPLYFLEFLFFDPGIDRLADPGDPAFIPSGFCIL